MPFLPKKCVHFSVQIKIHFGGRVFSFRYSVVEAFQVVTGPVQHSPHSPRPGRGAGPGSLRAVSSGLDLLRMGLGAGGDLCHVSRSFLPNFSL